MFPHRSFQDLGWARMRGHDDLSSQHIMMYTNTCNFIHQRRFFWFAILICVLYVSFLTPEAFSELFQCSDCFLSICIPSPISFAICTWKVPAIISSLGKLAGNARKWNGWTSLIDTNGCSHWLHARMFLLILGQTILEIFQIWEMFRLLFKRFYLSNLRNSLLALIS